MTTLTTRPLPLPLLPLALARSLSMTCNERSSSSSSTTAGSPTTPPLIASFNVNSDSGGSSGGVGGIDSSSMHPDNLLLPPIHGVTSPRLAGGVPGSGFCENLLVKTCDSTAILISTNEDFNNSNNGSSRSSKQSPTYGNGTEVTIRSDNNSENPQIFNSISNSNNNNNNGSDNNTIIDDDNDITDRMSCCSDDSELSVGQEGCGNNNNNNNNNNESEQNLKSLTDNETSVISDRGDSAGGHHCKQSQHEQMLDDNESFDNISNLSDENRLGGVGSVGGCDQAGSDDMSNDSSPTSVGNREIDPSLLSSAALRIPVPIVRPSPTRLQEEFLRKSHLYAEELMKQQMQFMAAARATAFSSLHRHAAAAAVVAAAGVSGGGVVTPPGDVGKVGFRPHIKSSSSSSSSMQPEINENLVNFNGIHSHLSAISKMSSQLIASNTSNNNNNNNNSATAESALSKLTAFGIGSNREMTQSPPFSNPLQMNHNHHSRHYHNHHHHLHLPVHSRHPFMNNNLNETNLKFSIDNILKADFGRRITDPLLKRIGGDSSGIRGNINGTTGKIPNFRKNRNNCEKSVDRAPVDLTNLVTGNLINSASVVDSSKCSSPLDNNTKQQSSRINKATISAAASNPASSSTIPSSLVTTATTAQSSALSSVTSASSVGSEGSAGGGGGGGGGGTAGGTSSEASSNNSSSSSSGSGTPMVWPAWVYCTRYSDRPSSGPRTRKPKKPPSEKGGSSSDEKRPRTAFSGPQLARLKHEFSENRYLTERRRQQLSGELGLNEAQIKIWFQNKRAKIKKASGTKNPLALQLMAQGLYNHSTVPLTREEEELQELQAANKTA